MSDAFDQPRPSNPYAPPGGLPSGDNATRRLLNGQPFRVESDLLICPKEVDLSQFCFYTGQDLSHTTMIFRKKLVIYCWPKYWKVFSFLLSITVAIALQLTSRITMKARIMATSVSVILVLIVILVQVLIRAVSPKTTVRYALSLDGDTAHASIYKWPARALICTMTAILGIAIFQTSIEAILPSVLSLKTLIGVVLVVGLAIAFFLKRATNTRGAPNAINATQVAPGVFRIENLTLSLLKSLSSLQSQGQ